MLRTVGTDSLLVPLGAQVAHTNGMAVLNETARCVWELLANECSVDELAAGVARRFDVDSERARADLQGLLDEMERMGLLQQ